MSITFKDLIQSLYYGFLVEGIDVDYKNKSVSLNHKHNKGVVTNTAHLIKDTINSITTFSIFKRIEGEGDANPLLKALKNHEGWKLGLEQDYQFIEQKIKQLSSELSGIDTIVLCPSSNVLNLNIGKTVSKSIQHKDYIENLFSKVRVEDAEMCDEVLALSDKKKARLQQSFDKIKTLNNGLFSFRLIDSDLRRYFTKCSELTSLNYEQQLNNKDILVVDDTITSGQTITLNIEALTEIYQPKSIRVLTLFSKLYPKQTISLEQL